VTAVEIKDVEIPDRMQHAIARQAEAERERRGKIIAAEGEFQAAARLNDAAEVISQNPVTIQLRYLQTLIEVSNNQSSTIVFPLPIDVLKPLVASAQERRATISGDEGKRKLDEALGEAQAVLRGVPSSSAEQLERGASEPPERSSSS
jgi:regulator of protease activity HflC (stomatin/prohibitin superfamily)